MNAFRANCLQLECRINKKFKDKVITYIASKIDGSAIWTLEELVKCVPREYICFWSYIMNVVLVVKGGKNVLIKLCTRSKRNSPRLTVLISRSIALEKRIIRYEIKMISIFKRRKNALSSKTHYHREKWWHNNFVKYILHFLLNG